MKKHLFLVTSILLLIGVVFMQVINDSKNKQLLTTLETSNLSIQEIVSLLEHKLDEPAHFRAGIDGNRLLLSDGTRQIQMDLREGLFYLSFAPYIQQTHPCAIHNLVTCRGEMKNKTLDVIITDVLSSDVIYQDQIKTKANGFYGFWLPVNRSYLLSVSDGTRSGSQEFSTYNYSDTCLTTLRLT